MPEESAGARVCVVESNEALRRDLAGALERSGFRVDAYPSAAQARAGSKSRGSTVRVLELTAPGVRGWLEDEALPGATILLVAETVSPDPRWRARPADLEILYKPFSLPVLESRILERIAARDAERVRTDDPILESREPDFIELLVRARRLARRSMPVTLLGEIGTGRRALARQMHHWSARRAMPFVSLERASLEAMGEPRADEVIREAVARAGSGTLLLVDPAEQRPRVQEALLASLRDAAEDDPRWLSIARQPLEESVREGRLLLELQYRLEVTTLALPPLRDRPLDQAAICRALARRVARELGQRPPEIDAELVGLLARDGFPGNRLGLESRLRGALMQSEGGRLWAAAAGASSRLEASVETPFLNLKTLERDTIIRALAHWDGNRTRASEALGISVRTLRNKIRDYGLR